MPNTMSNPALERLYIATLVAAILSLLAAAAFTILGSAGAGYLARQGACMVQLLAGCIFLVLAAHGRRLCLLVAVACLTSTTVLFASL